MVHIPVHYEDAAEAVRVEGVLGSQGHIVDEAEATKLTLHGVVARWSAWRDYRSGCYSHDVKQ